MSGYNSGYNSGYESGYFIYVHMVYIHHVFVEYNIDNIFYILSIDSCGTTPLMDAVRANSVESTRLILRYLLIRSIQYIENKEKYKSI